MQTKIHLINNITQVTAAPYHAAIVHLETLNDAVAIDLNSFRILTANIKHHRNLQIHDINAKPITKDFQANVLLKKQQYHPTVARADDISLFELCLQHTFERLAQFIHNRHQRC